MKERIVIRAAREVDLQPVLALEQHCTEAPHWSEAVWHGLLTAASDDPGLRAVFVAQQDAVLIGLLVLGGFGAIAELESVAVAPEHRGHGIGRALCAHAAAWARDRGALTMELEVRTGNAAARRLYASLGFVEQGVRRAYYRSPTEDAVLTALPLTAQETVR